MGTAHFTLLSTVTFFDNDLGTGDTSAPTLDSITITNTMLSPAYTCFVDVTINPSSLID